MIDIESKIISYREDTNDYRLCLTREEITKINQALTKQEPKKPEIKRHSVYEFYYCNKCGYYFGQRNIHNDFSFDKPRYCECGQKLDWNS